MNKDILEVTTAAAPFFSRKPLASTTEIDTLYGRLREADALREAIGMGQLKSVEDVEQFLVERTMAIEAERMQLLRERSQVLEAELVVPGVSAAPAAQDEPALSAQSESVKTLTYTQLVEQMEEIYPKPRQIVLDRQDVPTRRAWAVLDELKGRGGFDHLLGDLDPETEDEIFEELRKAVQVA